MTPSYLAAAATDSDAMFLTKAADKISKHAAGCDSLGQDFIPFVLTTLGGVGPPAFRQTIRDIFASLVAQSIASGATGRDVSFAFFNLQQTIQASIARSNYQTLDRHTQSTG